MDVNPSIGFPCNGGTHNVHDSVGLYSPAFSKTQCCKGIGGFTALAYHEHHRAIFKNWIPVSEFTCVLHVNRYSRKIFYDVLADKPRMPGGTAGGYNNASYSPHVVVRHVQTAQMRRPFSQVYSSPEGIPEGFGLGMYLFQHVMIETVLLYLAEVPVHMLYSVPCHFRIG